MMTRLLFSLIVLALLPAAPAPLRADPTNAAPAFKEVYDLLRSHLPGATEESLNRAAVRGLLARFPGRVSLIAGPADSATNRVLNESRMIEGNVAYLRVARVGANLTDELLAAYRALAATNKIAGVVLDLRFAGGGDTAAARAAAQAVQARFRPLAILVNGETRGAAVTLAAALRAARAGLILGGATAGAAADFKEFTLSDGERLRIQTVPATNAAPGASSGGLQPDIAIRVSASDGRAYYEHPYKRLAASRAIPDVIGTNVPLPVLDHTSEADLVREKQNAGDDENAPRPPAAGPPQAPGPAIQDPVLARAVDLIKGLAVVYHPSSS